MTATTPETRTLDNYVGGRWTPAGHASDALDVTNPASGDVLARVPLSGAEDLDAAVRAAREALPAWRAVSTPDRARILFALRAGLDARREELARSVTTEMGKTIADARAEVTRMIEMVECACAIPTTMQGRALEDVARGVDAETIRQPVGVCAAIVPFNFPAMVPFWFLPFAIGCGNAFVLKPSEQVPLTQQIAFEVLDGLGLPPGVVNLVNGGREVVEGILDHPGIDVGPVVSAAARDRIREWIDRGVAGGASLAVDGRAAEGGADGAWVGPTIVDEVTPEMDIAQEEVFGPVLSVVRVDTLDEAIEVVNRSRFGNGASIFTESGAAVRRFRHDVEAGMVGVNIGVAAPVAFFPFSGWKDSFLGDLHAHGPDAVEFYTRKKTVTSRYFSSGQASGAYFVED
jgi:acyl-CoA reductase-like NAD-dependent aldehyde dehydrogenase